MKDPQGRWCCERFSRWRCSYEYVVQKKRQTELAGYFGSSFSGPSLRPVARRDEHRRKGCEHEPAQPTRQQPAPARWGEHAKVQPNLPMFLLQRRRVTTWASSARPAAAKASPARAAAATPQVRVVDEPAVCQSLGEGVYELPAMLPRAACARVVAEVSARVSNGSATDRGASLKTTDVYVRDLADAEDVYRARASAGRSPMSRTENRARELVSTQALDAGCHLVELCTGRLVTYERKKAFVITYDATSTKVRRGGPRPFVSRPPARRSTAGASRSTRTARRIGRLRRTRSSSRSTVATLTAAAAPSSILLRRRSSPSSSVPRAGRVVRVGAPATTR